MNQTKSLLEHYCPDFITWRPPNFQLERLKFPKKMGNYGLSIINSHIKNQWSEKRESIILWGNSEIRRRTMKNHAWFIDEIFYLAINDIIKEQQFVCNRLWNKQNQYRSRPQKERIAWMIDLEVQCLMVPALYMFNDYIKYCLFSPIRITSFGTIRAIDVIPHLNRNRF